jgi:hypothetical protein
MNDLWGGRSTSDIVGKLTAMARSVRASGARATLFSVLPVDRPVFPDAQANVRALNAEIRAKAKQQGVVVVDAAERFLSHRPSRASIVMPMDERMASIPTTQATECWRNWLHGLREDFAKRGMKEVFESRINELEVEERLRQIQDEIEDANKPKKRGWFRGREGGAIKIGVLKQGIRELEWDGNCSILPIEPKVPWQCRNTGNHFRCSVDRRVTRYSSARDEESY